MARPGVDHGGPDPIQGYDVEIWVQRLDLVEGSAKRILFGAGNDANDTQLTSGGMVLLGQFTSFSSLIRTSSEAYLEYDSRVPIYFDGENQILFKMEKGLINMDVFRETFGVSVLGRRTTYNLLPRFNITINVNTVSFNERTNQYELELNNKVPFGAGLIDFTRHTNGRFVLKQAKIDAFNIEAQAGKHVLITTWTGSAEEFDSLPGNPPQVKNVEGKLVGAKANSGAWDTEPARKADTFVPYPLVSQAEEKQRDKIVQRRKAVLIAAQNQGVREAIENQIGAIFPDELGIGQEADTTLPTFNIMAQEARTQRQVAAVRKQNEEAELAEPPFANTALPRRSIMKQEQDRNNQSFIREAGRSLLQDGIGLVRSTFNF